MQEQNYTQSRLFFYNNISLCVQVRIQETQAELPRGSIPRSLEIVLRAEAVEMAQAGDRCDFTGTLIVVPDVSQFRTPGMDVTVTSLIFCCTASNIKQTTR